MVHKQLDATQAQAPENLKTIELHPQHANPFLPPLDQLKMGPDIRLRLQKAVATIADLASSYQTSWNALDNHEAPKTAPGNQNSVATHYKLVFDAKLTTPQQILGLEQISKKTGLSLEVTSGTRTPRQEAEADYNNFMNKNWLSTITARGTPAYKTVIKLEETFRNGKSKDQTISDMADVIRDAVNAGMFYRENHVNGLAVDIRIRNLEPGQLASLESAITGLHYKFVLEENTHLHVTLPLDATRMQKEDERRERDAGKTNRTK